ncbi:hypothetical protein [Sneathiella glossodoripedis]|uniref:hypothetical protein n=1 Tax=Sneathiella glossodoripedis TaxID=418853 RepID=UPI0004727623|nr:hypothetical protein [Sneathiella glossodoripedis]
MAGSNEHEKSSVEDAVTSSSREVEEILRAATEGSSDSKTSSAANTIESVDFMIDDQNELVDLDALFDALNVAAKDGVDAMSYIEDQSGTSILTVPSEALASAGVTPAMDDLGKSGEDLIVDPLVSDES